VGVGVFGFGVGVGVEVGFAGAVAAGVFCVPTKISPIDKTTITKVRNNFFISPFLLGFILICNLQ
jgi:hypothetical protein